MAKLVNQCGDEMSIQSEIDVDPVARVRTYIAEGGFNSGVKLPPERHLTETLGLTRAALRKALDVLERDGIIWRHVGKGTFISDNAPPNSDDASVKLGRQLTPFRMMRARMAIEPAIAREAAINATGESLLRMTQAISRARAASTWQAYEAEDDVLHRTVAEASDNLLLLSLFDQLNAVRRAVAWGNVERKTVHPSPNYISFEQHDAIVAAISSRDPQRAYDEMRSHLSSVYTRLFGEA